MQPANCNESWSLQNVCCQRPQLPYTSDCFVIAFVRILLGNMNLYSIFQRNTNTALNEVPLTRPSLPHTYSELQLSVTDPVTYAYH